MSKVYINTDVCFNDTNSIINYISSDRSDGKTTDSARRPYQRYHVDNKIGVRVSRFCTDITSDRCKTLITCLETYLDIKEIEHGKFTFKGNPHKDGVHFYEDSAEFLVWVPLSRASAIKSAFDFKTHGDVYFDEYIPLNRIYLSNEINCLLEIWRTIDRDHFSTKIYIYSNHVTASCPLFSYFNITIKDGVSRWKNGRILMLQVANKGNRNEIKKSPLGELVAETEYAEYISGGTLSDISTLIEPKHTKNHLGIILEHDKVKYAIFFTHTSAYVLDYAPDSKCPVFYTTEHNTGKAGGIYLPYATKIYQKLKSIYRTSLLLFASERIFEDTIPLQKLL